MRIAHLSAEVSPFAKTGGLGDVAGALPKAQRELGHDVQVYMPLYRQVWQELGRRGIHPEVACEPFSVYAGGRWYEVGVLRSFLPGSDVPIFFVGSDPHFDRPQLYSLDYWGQDDGVLRYTIWVRAVLEVMKKLWLAPDVLHAHDWHASLAPMALAWDRPSDWVFSSTRTVLTIHNLAYQGLYSRRAFPILGIAPEAFGGVEWNGAVNLLKGGITAANAITAVSPNFAREITTPAGGFGLDPVLRSRSASLAGIVNGIDTRVWNPATDPDIAFRYDFDHLEIKRENRKALLAEIGMDPEDQSFVVGLIGRLTEQKGFDLFFDALPDLLGRGVRFVFLGSGEKHLEDQVHHYSWHARGRFWGYVGFKEDLAHRIEAGVDSLLMPSRFEPCGLNQLYSLAYGTPPIVHRVGGLADTVIGYDGWNADSATGFSFAEPTPRAVRDTVVWAASAYGNMELWTKIARNGMAQNFSWDRSARAYDEVYRWIGAK